jgi:hypothetical protein
VEFDVPKSTPQALAMGPFIVRGGMLPDSKGGGQRGCCVPDEKLNGRGMHFVP